MRRLASLVACAVVLAGCVRFPRRDPNQRECLPPAGVTDPSTVARPTGTAVVKVLEYTDDGELTNRCALTDALLELRAPGPEIVLLYVHGWKHNGSATDSDLRSFRALVSRLEARERGAQNPRRVVGLYVAWNAKRTELPLLKEFTFWGRKRAADRVSQSAALTRLLGAVDHIREQRHQRGDLVVYAGHSFGARLLYSATAQLLVHQVQMAHPGEPGRAYSRVRGIGDLVVLINPAFEASLFSVFAAQRRYKESFDGDQPPLLLAVSADNDGATRTAFPVGQLFGLNFGSERRTTLGNYGKYQTHRLDLAPGGKASSQHTDSWFDRYCAASVCLARTSDDGQYHNPFIVARAGSDVVDGHNGIWRQQFIDWLTAFIGEIDRRRYNAP